MTTFRCVVTIVDKDGKEKQLTNSEHSGLIKASLQLLEDLEKFQTELDTSKGSQIQILEGDKVRFTFSRKPVIKESLTGNPEKVIL